MSEPFKNVFHRQMIVGMAGHFRRHWPAFDAEAFCDAASDNLASLALKARSGQIMQAMVEYLPADFSQAGGIMLASLSPAQDGDIFGLTVDETMDEGGIAGWAIMPMAHYVGLRGHDHFDLSMILFREFTKRFSSEFGIRFFLLDTPEKTLSVLKQWTTDNNRHVRRLISEGTRPRLPWAMRLPLFINDPAPVIEMLELLRDDQDAYVRRSVANNLNDIAKDHPDMVAELAKRWMQGADKQRKQLVRHACRTLIKQGNQTVLQLFGFQPPEIGPVVIVVQTPEVLFGTALQFSVSLSSNAEHNQALMIDYVIHHRRANGKTSAKVFKWRKISLAANTSLSFTRKHVMKKITTRMYYPGLHHVEVMVNGVSVGSAEFQLLIPLLM